MARYTFVVQVHPDGIPTLENLAKRERVQIAELAALGPQIEGAGFVRVPLALWRLRRSKEGRR